MKYVYIYVSVLILLMGCSSINAKKSKVISCYSINKEFNFYKSNGLVNCDSKCIQNKTANFRKNLKQLFVPFIRKAKELDLRKLNSTKQLFHINQSNSYPYCGQINKKLNSIFQRASKKEKAVKSLMEHMTEQYYDILTNAIKLHKGIANKKNTNPIVKTGVAKRAIEKKNNKSESKILQIRNITKPKNTFLKKDKCKTPLQNLRYHLMTEGKNNEYYLIYKNEYNKCLQLYNKGPKQ